MSNDKYTVTAVSDGNNYSFTEYNSEGIKLKADLCNNGAFYIESLGNVSLNGSLFVRK